MYTTILPVRRLVYVIASYEPYFFVGSEPDKVVMMDEDSKVEKLISIGNSMLDTYQVNRTRFHGFGEPSAALFHVNWTRRRPCQILSSIIRLVVGQKWCLSVRCHAHARFIQILEAQKQVAGLVKSLYVQFGEPLSRLAGVCATRVDLKL